MYGNRWLSEYRIRNRFILGAVLEQKVERNDGSVEWVRIPSYRSKELTNVKVV